MNYDSAGWIENQRHIFASGSVMDVIRIFPQRPIVMMTFYANFLLADMAPVYFRLVNIFILSCTALVVVLLVDLMVRLAASGRAEDGTQARFAGILAGLLFLVHPLQTTVTLYIWQRSALMACFFYYASLFAYFAARTGRFRSTLASYSLCGALFVCALFSKENAVTLPFLMILADAVFFRDKWRTLVKRSAIYLAITGLGVVFLSLVNRAHGNMTYSQGILSQVSRHYEESGLALTNVVMTQPRVLFTYIKAIVFPLPSNVQLTSPQVVSTSLFSPPDTIIALIFAALLIIAGVYLLKRRPLSGFGAVFFLANLLPEGFLVPQYQFFGYRAVLPMLGVLLVGTDSMLVAIRWVSSSTESAFLKRALAACGTIVVVGLAAISAMKASLWADPIHFWKDTVSRFPKGKQHVEKLAQTQAFHNLGVSLQARGQYEEALDALREAADSDPRQVRSLAALGAVYAELGRLPEAETALKRALAVDPAYVLAYRHLGDVLTRRGSYEEALEQYRQGLALAPHNDDLHDAMGRTLFAQGQGEEAIRYLTRAVQLNPRSFVSLSNLGAVLLSQGKTDQALEHLEKSVRLRPDYWRAHENLGVAHAMEGRIEKAVDHFKQAVTLNPKDQSARENLNTALEQLSEKKK